MKDNESWLGVGTRIRKLRKENGLTLKQLAAGCDLSPNAISLVERGEVAPTVMTLCKIAHALGVSAASFFQDICPTEVILQRAGERPDSAPPEAAVRALVHSRFPVVSSPDNHSVCSMPNRMTQMVLCVSGSIEYQVDDQRYLLNPGDSLTFNGDASHRWRNPGQAAGVAVMVLIPQTRSTAQEVE